MLSGFAFLPKRREETVEWSGGVCRPVLVPPANLSDQLSPVTLGQAQSLSDLPRVKSSDERGKLSVMISSRHCGRGCVSWADRAENNRYTGNMIAGLEFGKEIQ